MDSMEKFHGHTGKIRTLSTDSMDFFHWFHGLSTDWYISRSIDIVKNYVELRRVLLSTKVYFFSSDSCKHETLHRYCT